ncbi:MAG: helicase [Deltaproteobacteria bacterium]|nr:helicase [Deltaproteobacteria bacterium]
MIGDVEDGLVVEVTITARGRDHDVLALLDRPRAGQVVVHNHPGGDLRPSDADMALASVYGEDGVGFVIVDSEVRRDNWVVEPVDARAFSLDQDQIEALFSGALSKVPRDWEVRPAQVSMARGVARALSDATPLAVEAGTGTGKSLAYLVPAAQWALGADGKVVVSTFTRALQSQLLLADIPILRELGMDVRVAVLQGRSNYLCKRRLGHALEHPGDDEEVLHHIAEWEEQASGGSTADLPFQVPREVWERVSSDSDLTLNVRCPHYTSCHYYRARRQAAGAHIIVVNHALLLADLQIKESGARGVLPKFGRLILDEAHHLEDAATNALTRRLTARAVQLAVAPLLPRGRRKGALDTTLLAFQGAGSPLNHQRMDRLQRRLTEARTALESLPSTAGVILENLFHDTLAQDPTPRRVTPADEALPWWSGQMVPSLHHLEEELLRSTSALQEALQVVDDLELPVAQAQALLDLQRAVRRLLGHAETVGLFLKRDQAQCRWMEPARGRGESGRAALVMAPIDMAALLRQLLWRPLPGTAATSATLTTGGNFSYWAGRVGLDEAREEVFPSPFDHQTQALLGLPRDLPSPDSPTFLARSAEVLVDAVRVSEGGAFVLCTSYRAVDEYARALRRALPSGWPVLAQGELARPLLLERFKAHRNAVLVGTDSFWEGVNVKGDGLRLVIIPRLPFRVPTEPLQVARQEALKAQGLDPFRAFSLPQAIIKLKQGYGRLIRSRTDRGVVLFLDNRLHTKLYGKVMLLSMPPARQVKGPWRLVKESMAAFYQAGPAETSP